MVCPYCNTQVSADGSCSCQSKGGKLPSPAPVIRMAGADAPKDAVHTERLPFHGLELPIP
jgi:hypothetical protein